LYTNQPGQNSATFGFFSPIQPDPASPTENYWPISALIINNQIYVICERINGGLNLVGIDILKLNAYPYNDPSQWTYEYLSSIPGITNTLTIGNAFTIGSDNYIYLFGATNNPYNGIVTRISQNNFVNGNWNTLQVYSNNQWKLYYSTAIPDIITSSLALTSAVYYSTFIKKWLILNIDVYGPKVGLFYSDYLQGPWIGPIFIYEIPSEYLINDTINYYCPNFHPEFIKNANEIYWTYNLNTTGGFGELETDLAIYTPKMIKTIVNIQDTKSCY